MKCNAELPITGSGRFDRELRGRHAQVVIAGERETLTQRRRDRALLEVNPAMKPRHAAVLALSSIFALVTLMLAGALWFIATINGIYELIPWWLSHFRGLPWNPSGILAAFDCVVIVLVMLPWAALCAWGYWIIEGAWLDLLDPSGRVATDDLRFKER
jgi:hypothetical protein